MFLKLRAYLSLQKKAKNTYVILTSIYIDKLGFLYIICVLVLWIAIFHEPMVERFTGKFNCLLFLLQDLDILELVKWEAVIIDECQRCQISVHLKQIKKLSADMRLLLVSCQVKVCGFHWLSVSGLSLNKPTMLHIQET